jgi:hypothetical protein
MILSARSISTPWFSNGYEVGCGGFGHVILNVKAKTGLRHYRLRILVLYSWHYLNNQTLAL